MISLLPTPTSPVTQLQNTMLKMIIYLSFLHSILCVTLYCIVTCVSLNICDFLAGYLYWLVYSKCGFNRSARWATYKLFWGKKIYKNKCCGVQLDQRVKRKNAFIVFTVHPCIKSINEVEIEATNLQHCPKNVGNINKGLFRIQHLGRKPEMCMWETYYLWAS